MKYIMQREHSESYYRKGKQRRSYYARNLCYQLTHSPLRLPINIKGNVVVPAFFLKGDWK